MKKHSLLTSLLVIIAITISTTTYAQKYVSKNGHIKFFSSSPMEDIEANNHQVNCAYDAETGDLVFKVVMKSFEFEKALMQEHFNENYVMSDKYPNSIFKGKVVNFKTVDVTKDGTYEVEIEGELTIKGETNPVKSTGSFVVKGDEIDGNSVFNILLEDYKVKIPKAVTDNISETIEITVDVNMVKL